MLIFKEVANRSNFMNYLVMSTPVLAYAIAKASEQGFVSFASGLSQALTGASRTAGSFANQQAALLLLEEMKFGLWVQG
ncbi:hypothetical protein I9055_07020 [Campylobacter jejuni]|nr:hypothetical protein [Campylobacter jejuni]MBX1033500.1 hypothetical protein [Campylobacter jejuni]